MLSSLILSELSSGVLESNAGPVPSKVIEIFAPSVVFDTVVPELPVVSLKDILKLKGPAEMLALGVKSAVQVLSFIF